MTNTNVTTLTSAGGLLVAGTSQGSTGGVYLSSDNGETWTLSKSDPWVTSILIVGSTIFVGSFGDGVWRSTNNGTTWGQINDGFAGAAYYVLSLAANGQFIFAGTNNANVWRRPLSQVTGAKSETYVRPEETRTKASGWRAAGSPWTSTADGRASSSPESEVPFSAVFQLRLGASGGLCRNRDCLALSPRPRVRDTPHPALRTVLFAMRGGAHHESCFR